MKTRLVLLCALLGACDHPQPTPQASPYVALDGPLTFPEAQAACAAMGGTVATVDDQETLDAAEVACGALSTTTVSRCWTASPAFAAGTYFVLQAGPTPISVVLVGTDPSATADVVCLVPSS